MVLLKFERFRMVAGILVCCGHSCVLRAFFLMVVDVRASFAVLVYAEPSFAVFVDARASLNIFCLMWEFHSCSG